MGGKSLMKHHCPKKKTFMQPKYEGYYSCILHAYKKYHDLFLKSDTLLDPEKFPSAPGLAFASSFKITEVK